MKQKKEKTKLSPKAVIAITLITLVVCIVAGVIAVMIFIGDVSGGIRYEKSSDGTYYIVKKVENYHDSGDEIVIPDTYGDLPVKEIAAEAFLEYTYTVPEIPLKKITIGKNVEKIGEEAFSGCRFLESVVFADGSACKEIGDYAFSGCDSLKTITLPDGLETIGENAFCATGIETVDIPDSVTTLGDYCFYTALKSINIGAGVSEIGRNALGYERLESITVDAANENFEVMNGCLYSEDKTVLVRFAVTQDYSWFDVPHTVDTIRSGAFDGADHLRKINIPIGVIYIEKEAIYETVADVYCEVDEKPITWEGDWYIGSGTVYFGQ